MWSFGNNKVVTQQQVLFNTHTNHTTRLFGLSQYLGLSLITVPLLVPAATSNKIKLGLCTCLSYPCNVSPGLSHHKESVLRFLNVFIEHIPEAQGWILRLWGTYNLIPHYRRYDTAHNAYHFCSTVHIYYMWVISVYSCCLHKATQEEAKHNGLMVVCKASNTVWIAR